MPRKETGRSRYHHGNLRSALLDAGMQIVESEGVDRLSLREVARRAKVTHSAPYHHFADKAELLAAVAAAGFDRMLESMSLPGTASDANDPVDQLRAVGAGYMRFAARHPSLFRLMFRPELTRPTEHQVLQQAEGRAIAKLLDVITACQKAGEFPGNDPAPLAAFAWSSVHGLSMLNIDQVLQETPLGRVPFAAMVTVVNEMVILALQNPELKSVFAAAKNSKP